jgi:3D (Asp-Asp-Asp) domain-containing protein
VIARTSISAAAVSVCLLLAGCGGGARVAGYPAARHDPAPQGARHEPKQATQVAARVAACNPHAPREHRIARREWLSGFIVTEYYPVPERWFDGLRVPTPGTPERHRVDWLYSANGVSMQGDGIDLQGRHMHIADLGAVGWVTTAGKSTVPPRCGIHWSHGPPAWRAGGWRNRLGQVTYPLAAGGWSNGFGHLVGDYGGATFAPGPSLPLSYYHSVAVDPRLIPFDSRIFIPAYRNISGGWFVAKDTGGAIIGRHIDVYRPPTSRPFGTGRLLLNERVYVIPPGT